MRAVSGIFLVALLLLQSVGTHVLFQVQRFSIGREIKHAIKQGVPVGQRSIFNFPKNSTKLHWTNDHEFMFEEVMYDVVSRSDKTDTIYVECITDKDETLLFANLGNLLSQKWNAQNQQENQQLVQLALGSPYIRVAEIMLIAAHGTNASRNFWHSAVLCDAPAKEKTPPPEFSFYI